MKSSNPTITTIVLSIAVLLVGLGFLSYESYADSEDERYAGLKQKAAVLNNKSWLLVNKDCAKDLFGHVQCDLILESDKDSKDIRKQRTNLLLRDGHKSLALVLYCLSDTQKDRVFTHSGNTRRAYTGTVSDYIDISAFGINCIPSQ